MIGEPLDLDVDYLVQEYRSGRSSTDLAREFGVSVKPITDRLKAAGVTIRGHRHQGLDVDAMVERHLGGEAVSSIADSLGVTYKVVARRIEERGVELIDWRRPIYDEDRAVEMYADGIGAAGVAEEMGVSPNVIIRMLKERGIHIRDRSEQQQARMDRASDEEIRQLTKAANEAVRGRTKTFEELCLAAQTRERRQSTRTSKAERRLRDMISHLDPVPQKAIGPYNCDLAVHPVAVEVFGGGWHWYGAHFERAEERFRYIMDQGWYILVVSVNLNGRFPLTPAVGDYVVSEIERARRDPSLIGQYRVIWGAGEFSTGGRLEDDDFSIEPPF